MGYRTILIVSLLLVSTQLPLDMLAQDPVAAIEGEVLDPSALAVAGATVTVANLDTGYSKNYVTSANGSYRFSLLPIGRYSVSIEATGFSRFLQQPVQLNVSQTVRLDVRLQLASHKHRSQ